LESAQAPLTSTQYHTPTRHIRTHATGHSDRDPEEKIAYLVRKWILAEANIPVDAEYLGQKFVSGDKKKKNKKKKQGVFASLPGPSQEVRGR
jgi:hypothetical protein